MAEEEVDQAFAEGLEELEGLGGEDEGIEGLEGLAELEAELADNGEEGGDPLDGGVDEQDLELPPMDDPPADEVDEDAELMDGVEVQEHLKDAVEGSLRLKRMLSRDEDGGDKKRVKLDDETMAKQAKGRQLMIRWGCMQDAVMNHVLEECSIEELQFLINTNFSPNKFDQKKTPAELVRQQLILLKEKEIGGGSRIDVVSAFKIRWKLDLATEKQLRALNHKDLRYVIDMYDKSQPLAELITEAENNPVDEENALNAVPTGAGPLVMGRFNRLELIDPLADCAVFGDANLTFSLNLATHRKGFGHVGRVIATTFEEVETLRQRYTEIDSSIQKLEELDSEVYHGVDCTRIAIDPRFDGMEGRLGAVYYNFPHSGAIQGFFDSHPMVNWRHENLMRLFFRALRHFVKPGGVVKVSSNSGAVGVRYSYIVGSAIENEFTHVETMPFMEWHLHRYGRSYGDRRDLYKRPDAKNNQSYNAQNAHSDMVYCFAYAPSGNTIPKQTVRMPPTLKTLKECRDGPFKNLGPGPSRENLAKQLHGRFVTEVSGTHVG